MRRVRYPSLPTAFITLPTLAIPVTMISENAITGRAVATAKTAGTPGGCEARRVSGTSIAKKGTAESRQKPFPPYRGPTPVSGRVQLRIRRIPVDAIIFIYLNISIFGCAEEDKTVESSRR